MMMTPPLEPSSLHPPSPVPLSFITTTPSPLASYLHSGALLSSVPFYDPHNHPSHHSLVRVRGMCIDILDPEIYVREFSLDGQTHSAAHLCSLPPGATYNDHSLAERQIVLLRDVPGETEWAQQQTSSPLLSNNKRGRLGRPSFLLVLKTHAPVLLHQVVDVVGLVSLEPDALATDPELTSFLPSDALRVHALSTQTLAQLYTSPAPPVSGYSQIRSHLVDLLTSDVFRGDRLAAEFLLLSLVSRVLSRPCEDLVLGKLALGLSQCQHDVNGPLLSALSRLVPSVVPVDCSREALEREAWSPRKDCEANRLLPGLLQLPAGACVVVDESKLGPGTLSPQGVANIAALRRLGTNLDVTYEFGYFARPQPLDVNLLVVSPNKQPLTPCDVVLPLRPVALADGEALLLMRPERLDECRAYLAACRSAFASLELPDAVAREVERKFVEARQSDNAVSQQSLHLWLGLARAVAASYGHARVSSEGLGRALVLEAQRKLRG